MTPRSTPFPAPGEGEGRPDLSVVIPCYDEESGLRQMASDLQPVLEALSDTRSVEVVLVDDGSSDDTWARLTELSAARAFAPAAVTLVRHERNKGLGAALRTGLASARGRILVTTDSDSTYRFTEIPALLSRLTSGVDIVTASPYHPDGMVAGVPGYRLVLSRGSSLIYRLLVNWRVHTYTSLFRAYRAEVVRAVPFFSDGYLGVAELLVNALLAGFRVAEYPTTLHVRAIGTSKVRLLRTIVAHLRFQSAILLRRLRIGRHHGPGLSVSTAGEGRNR
jgi:dolichol-phosphate mannosyltransferase